MSLTQQDLDQLDVLKKQRSYYKGQITIFKRKYSAGDSTSIGSCESILHRIRTVYEKYSDIQSKIELLDASALNDRELFEDEYGSLESDILNNIHGIKKQETNVSFQNSSVLDIPNPSTASLEMRLPEIKLPTFSGLETDWLRFRDIFKELVHKRNIDQTIKFHYLISHISGGTAYSLIEGIPVTAENYNLAWDTIYNKYNNENRIQKMYLKQLYDIRSTVPNSSESLQAFIDQAVKHYNSLKSLQVPVESWNLLLVHHLSEKLDNSSRADVIKGSNDQTLLTFDNFIKILQSRVRLLAALKHSSSSNLISKPNSTTFQKYKRASTLVAGVQSCLYCNGNHMINSCPDFGDIKLTPKMRYEYIRSKRICTNCLSSSHNVRTCTSQGCNKCSLKHHSLLHFNFDRKPYTSAHISQSDSTRKIVDNNTNELPCLEQTSVTNTNPELTSDQHVMLGTLDEIPHGSSLYASSDRCNSLNLSSHRSQIMIGTAVVKAVSSNGDHIFARVLLDSGSHLNFITDKTCRLLNLKMHPTSKQVFGMGSKITSLNRKVFLSLASRTSDHNISIKCYVIPKITGDLPLMPINFNKDLIPTNVELADPHFNTPNRIDILIGAELYHELFTGKSLKLIHELPMFYDSIFGYVVSGKTNINPPPNVSQQYENSLCSVEVLDSQIKKFWELENIVSKTNYSIEEKLCEDHFLKNFKRLPSGRYSVALPLNSKIVDLGSSSESARRQFFNVEKRLNKNPTIYQQYKDFMAEYIELNHMELVDNPNINQCMYNQTYYLPHHFVQKESSSTTKLRVVFNASNKSSSLISLNDCMMVGPVVQTDLFSLVLRFRKYKVAFSADIAKMYRQILLHDNHRDLHRIWWRMSQFEPLQCYKLRTVTYGTASAPYLATRAMNQLATDETSFPEASKVLKDDFYVDDVLTGADNIQDALALKQNLIELLKRGGFDLRKFVSNIPELADDSSTNNLSLILGLLWNTNTDQLEMSFEKLNLNTPSKTKRNVLSEICQLFDPLGLCAPLILTAKLFMQELWTIPELKWDNLPDTFLKRWSEFKAQLVQLKQISIPRCIIFHQHNTIELHGFGDASESGFGCVFYIRTTDHFQNHHISLVCSKSRVAPLKKQTIPRLELCAALLLAQISHKLLSILKINFDFIYLWCDSEITLFRINSEPHRYAIFIANRITQIQELTSINCWTYVPTSMNTADYVSRGLYPINFVNATDWWNAPEYSSKDKSKWTQRKKKSLSLDIINLDLRKMNPACITPMSNNPLDMTALYPGHFLIGAPLTAIPDPDVTDLKLNRLSRYQMLQQILQQFWKRWHREYLSELQTRHKWNNASKNIKINDLVILHDDNLPPMHWPLGRIIELHCGTDNRVRVVTVKTAYSVFKRAINKISILPIETNGNEIATD